jgi:hypothetical protein
MFGFGIAFHESSVIECGGETALSVELLSFKAKITKSEIIPPIPVGINSNSNNQPRLLFFAARIKPEPIGTKHKQVKLK